MKTQDYATFTGETFMSFTEFFNHNAATCLCEDCRRARKVPAVLIPEESGFEGLSTGIESRERTRVRNLYYRTVNLSDDDPKLDAVLVDLLYAVEEWRNALKYDNKDK